MIDGEVFLLRWRGRDIAEVRRLRGPERQLALERLDDCHAEVEALVLGHEGW